MNFFYIFLATGFGVGTLTAKFTSFLRQKFKLPIHSKWSGAGYFGSLEGLVFCVLLAGRNVSFILPILVVATLFSVYISHQAEAALKTHDDPSIVIDEVVGIMWAGALLPNTIWTWVFVFVLFRIFDVAKLPWRGAQKLPGGWGIVIDDVLAGIFANVIIRVFLRL